MTKLGKITLASFIAGVALYFVMYFWIDRPVDLWVHAHYPSGMLKDIGSAISQLMNGYYIKRAAVIVFLYVILADPKLKSESSRKILFICASVLVGVIISESIKCTLARYRPVMLFEKGLYGFHYISGKYEFNSTPSGHTTRAFCFFVAMSVIYRKFTPVFITLATMIGLSRIAVTAHYPSDVLFGAFIGIFTPLWLNKCLFNFERQQL